MVVHVFNLLFIKIDDDFPLHLERRCKLTAIKSEFVVKDFPFFYSVLSRLGLAINLGNFLGNKFLNFWASGCFFNCLE